MIQQHCAMFIGCLCQRLQAAGIRSSHGSEQNVFSCLQKFTHLPEIQTAVIRKIYDVCFLQSAYPQSSYLQSSFFQKAFLQIQVLTPGCCFQKGAAFCVAAITAMDIMVISAMVIPPFPCLIPCLPLVGFMV